MTGRRDVQRPRPPRAVVPPRADLSLPGAHPRRGREQRHRRSAGLRVQDQCSVLDVQRGVGEHEALASGDLQPVEAVGRRVVEDQHPHPRQHHDARRSRRRAQPDDRGAVAALGLPRAADRDVAVQHELHRDPRGRHQHDDLVAVDREPGDDLGGGAAQLEFRGQGVPQRPRQRDARREVDRHGRDGHLGAVVEGDGHLHALLRGQRLPLRLVRGEEQVAATPVAAHGPPQLVGPCAPAAHGGGHGREPLALGLQPQVLAPQRMVVGPDLSVLADGGPEVVAELRDVVGVAGGLRLLLAADLAGHDGGPLGPAGVHVVALPDRAAADLGQGEGGDVAGGHQGAPVVGHVHPAAQLAGGERQRVVVLERDGRRVEDDPVERLAQVGADGQVVADRAVPEVRRGELRPLGARVLPEAVGVGAVHGQQRARDLRAAPAGGRPQRDAQPEVLGGPAQRGEVHGLVVQLVVHLRGDDRPSLGVGEPGQPADRLGVEGPHEVEVGGVVGAGAQATLHEPVREAAQTRLAVRPRAEPDDDVQPVRRGELDEGAQVQVAVPAEVTRLRLVRPPEHVGRHRVQAAGPGVTQHLRPALARDP